eukprot:3354664-Rhodomonas_salina.2
MSTAMISHGTGVHVYLGTGRHGIAYPGRAMALPGYPGNRVPEVDVYPATPGTGTRVPGYVPNGAQDLCAVAI